MNQEKRPITLEDLLRLKRAERPPAEFWDQFDRELRAKQLAALVAKRPWWRSLPAMFSGFSRYQLPLGATAALAITFFVTRELRTTPSVQAEPATRVVAAATRVEPSMPDIRADMAATISAAPSVADESNSEDNAAAVASSEETASANTTRTSAVFGEVLAPDNASPSARTIAANLAAAQAAAPGVARGLLTSARGFESRGVPQRAATVEPLAQMASPSDVRQAKFASALATSFSRETPSRSNDRGARSLPDERLYDGAVRRFDAKADRFTLKL